jgi:D-amino peptidase
MKTVFPERILLLCDLEGVGGVVGVPYEGLHRGTEQWEIARRQAARELNAGAGALFAAGARTVVLWDNHGGGGNIDPGDLDPRIATVRPAGPRLGFAEGNFDRVCFFGYHAMEGTLGGVLAHTMNSARVQFYRLDGDYIGEVDMDAAIAGSYGIPCCFFAGGDIACAQASRAVPGIATVVTKTELERNRALFRDNAELLPEIAGSIAAAVADPPAPKRISFPCVFEKSFKRVEDAAVYLSRLRAAGLAAEHPSDPILGRDAHTVRTPVRDVGEFVSCI